MDYLQHGRVGDFYVAAVATEGHRFDRHSHDDFVISANLAGREAVWLDGKTFEAAAGDLTAYNPGEIQGGGARAGEPWQFVSLYLAPTALETALHVERAQFERPRITHPALAAQLAAAVRAALSDDAMTRARGEEVLVEAVGSIARDGGMRVADCRPSGAALAERVKALLADHLQDGLALDTLADAVGLSKYHLLRAFTQQVGVSPRTWAMQLRVRRAQALLRLGGDLADTALALGFADQSHLTRHFLRAYGTTPARYQRSVR